MESERNLHRIDHASENGVWTLFRYRPRAALAPYVHEIQGYFEEGGMPLVRKELPSQIIPLILVLGPGFALEEPGRRPRALERSFVAGLYEGPVLVGSEGRAVCMQVDLTVIGARRFLNLDMDEIAGRVVDLAEILGRAGRELEERIGAADDWASRFELLEGILCRRILATGREDPRFDAALRAIHGSGGTIRIGRLAAELGVSRKHMNALFRRGAGLAPKPFARVLRFERAIGQLRAGAFGSLADLAAASGYADQAHFNRDFRAFAGESPTTLMARMLPDGTGLMADRR